MNKQSIFALVAGLAVGAAGAWFITKKRYDKLIQEEVDSVKDAFAKKEEIYKERQAKHKEELAKAQELSDYETLAGRYNKKSEEADYIVIPRNEKYINPPVKEPVPPEEKTYREGKDGRIEEYVEGECEPYLISMDEFREGKGAEYEPIFLTYFEDNNALVDENFNVVDNWRDTVGCDWPEVFELGDDTAYVRNDDRQAEYEIKKGSGDYHTALRNRYSGKKG